MSEELKMQPSETYKKVINDYWGSRGDMKKYTLSEKYGFIDSNGRKEGPWFQSSAREYRITHYHRDVTHGTFTSQYLNGQTMFTGEFVNGRKEGPWKQWNEDGTPNADLNYLNDLLHGECIYYGTVGSKPLICNYCNGEQLAQE